ncbi:hypothetical protein RW1_044_00210 [Rhodococcus wratislaviensis NBRC 100605]|uniref:Uncharacterized protein n=1 Tax=Rhodococcus wratislaviensis NBRC 100605 TaxID=1219028 RepID=X0PWJ7_RHOWR|nr:hypothetical protein RW1_044_00210 [Rhodococcus wratislaviensis NBRC 100605]
MTDPDHVHVVVTQIPTAGIYRETRTSFGIADDPGPSLAEHLPVEQPWNSWPSSSP